MLQGWTTTLQVGIQSNESYNNTSSLCSRIFLLQIATAKYIGPK